MNSGTGESFPIGQEEIDPVAQQQFANAVEAWRPLLSLTKAGPISAYEGEFPLAGIGVKIAIIEVGSSTSYSVIVKESPHWTEAGTKIRTEKCYKISQGRTLRNASYEETYFRFTSENIWEQIPSRDDDFVQASIVAVDAGDEALADRLLEERLAEDHALDQLSAQHGEAPGDIFSNDRFSDVILILPSAN